MPSLTRLAANTIAQATGVALGAVTGFLTFLLAARGLGPAGYGNFAAATIYLLLPITLADVGLSTSMLRQLSAEPARAEYVMRRALPLRLGVALLCLGVAVPLAWVLPFTSATRDAIAVGSVGAVFTLITLALVPLLQAQLQMHLVVVASLAGRILTVALAFGAFLADVGLLAYVAAGVAGAFLTLLLMLSIVARMVPLWPVFDRAYWKWLLRDSLAIGVANSLFQSYFRIDTVLVALLRTSREVGFYGAAYKFVELGELFVSTIGTTLFPAFTQLAADRDERLPRAVQKSFDLVVAVVAPLVAVMLIAPRPIITFTAGEKFASAALALRLLAPYLFLVVVTGIFWRLLAALHADKRLVGIAGLVLVLNVALNLIFIPTYGYKAAAITSGASEVVLLTLACSAIWQHLRWLPGLRYLPQIACGVGVVTAITLLLPGPQLVAAGVGLAAYALFMAVVPGVVRDVRRGLLRRPAREAGAGGW
jgi:O-antigen/teichoic acid export membrane protein